MDTGDVGYVGAVGAAGDDDASPMILNGASCDLK